MIDNEVEIMQQYLKENNYSEIPDPLEYCMIKDSIGYQIYRLRYLINEEVKQLPKPLRFIWKLMHYKEYKNLNKSN